MSLDATRWAWQQKCRPSHKLVLLSLADRANEGHECFPSLSRLIEDTGLDRKTIMDSIVIMESMGLVAVVRRTGARNAYRLIGVAERHPEKPVPKTAPVPKTGLEPVPETAPVPKTVPVPKTGPYQSQKRDYHQYQKRDTNLPIESIKESTRENPPPDGLDLTAWKRWFVYRAEIKKPIKKPSIEAAQKKLAAHGKQQAAVVEQSIANGWQGLFELKGVAVAQEGGKRDWI